MPSTHTKPASAPTKLTHPQSEQSVYYQHLAHQIQHNLQYQHDWVDLRIHGVSPLFKQPLPRLLISGLPPHRIYVHPDDQAEELKRGIKDEEVKVDREWVLPTDLKEKWSLRKFAEVFDAIGDEPPGVIEEDEKIATQETGESITGQDGTKKRRGGKRLLLATLGDDSTVVYYVIHDGIVKPRQN